MAKQDKGTDSTKDGKGADENKRIVTGAPKVSYKGVDFKQRVKFKALEHEKQKRYIPSEIYEGSETLVRLLEQKGFAERSDAKETTAQKQKKEALKEANKKGD